MGGESVHGHSEDTRMTGAVDVQNASKSSGAAARARGCPGGEQAYERNLGAVIEAQPTLLLEPQPRTPDFSSLETEAGAVKMKSRVHVHAS
jgi:hypothetical protein